MSFIAPRSEPALRTHSPSLRRMLADIAIAARSELAGREARIAAAIGAHLAEPDLLEGQPCPCSPERYVRHLLQADPEGGYAVVALAWRPGQMSPVHAHRTWCALGVYAGILTEGFYTPDACGQPVQTGSVLRPPGATCHGPADPHLIHRLANLSSGEAISIHVYGAAFDRFGEDVNLVYAG
ncbi:cysteine dioxygenase family protein [Pseudoroseomonas cervicalis]|uniref:cysteine dioxygenase family protein n=1 Tax=Teichococcus cervicalis TaxID=204525 RepID=UPI0022F1BB2A|nr:cysteine dioxygenase family protein [Pseudoroseomonas cervicalis]WBV41689.1 cysteine dioxygenase family protein [Pseudoroseomonas cervicalis]